MYFEKKPEQIDKKIKELSVQMEKLNQEIEDLFDALDVTSEQLTQYICNKEHFSEENWETLQSEKGKLNEKLSRDLANIRNPKAAKKAYQERNIPPHSLFI